MTPPPVPPSRSYSWYALGLLSLTNLLSFINRNIVFALFEPIKRDLRLSDAQLGWLASSYVLVFALAALPFGLLGDLRSRRGVVAGGVLLWSVCTLASGFATGFGELLFARAIAGAGGAAFGAAAQSLAADYFPSRGRAVAMGILAAGITLGGVLGIWLGGHLEAAYGWRTALFAASLPGFVLAALTVRLRDPVRAPKTVSIAAGMSELEMGLTSLVRPFLPLLLGLAIGGILAFQLDRVSGADSKVDVAAFGAAVAIGLAFNIRIWVRRLARTPTSGPRALVRAFGDLAESLTLVLRTPTLVYIFVGGAFISFGVNGLVGWAPTFMARELEPQRGPGGHAARDLGARGGHRRDAVRRSSSPTGSDDTRRPGGC